MTEEDEEFQRLEREVKMRRIAEEDDDIQDYKKPWVGLTEWEREAIALECGAMSADWLVFIEAVEKALKEKNT